PILLPGTHGHFDFMRVDTSANRLLLAQEEGNGAFLVFDLNSKKLLKRVPTSTSQDAAVDLKNDRYYVSGNDPHRMVIVSRKTLRVLGVVPVPANTDLIGYNPNTGQVYESNDTAGEVWVIDPSSKKILTTIKLPGSGVEDLAFDPQYQKLYQAVKGSNMIAEIDPASNQVLHSWPLAPDTGPHGIAMVPESNGLLVACAGKLVLMDRTNGKILSRADIAQGVDQIAYDPGAHKVYCASKLGKISVVWLDGNKLTSVGDVPDEPGTHSIAVDPNTHIVWIDYGKGKEGNECFVQPFTLPSE
ncbi:MAG: YncE family protein, partial [Terriglobia bacterium]